MLLPRSVKANDERRAEYVGCSAKYSGIGIAAIIRTAVRFGIAAGRLTSAAHHRQAEAGFRVTVEPLWFLTAGSPVH